ncbi:pyruvate kinase [bacterium]|nr:pyruvate kinase [bacterium]
MTMMDKRDWFYPRAKIIATLGPSSHTKEAISAMVLEGATLLRINLSHTNQEEIAHYVQLIREVSTEVNLPLSIIADLPGPKIRIHDLSFPLQIRKGETLYFSKSETAPYPTENQLVVKLNYPDALEDVNINEAIYIDDGQIQVRVISEDTNFLICEALNDGTIKPNKGVNFPYSNLHICYPTDEDIEWIHFLCSHHFCDYLALSFVRTVGDVERIKDLASAYSPMVGIIAKIEKHEALRNLPAIIHAADAVMVARGDLGIEMPIEDIPLLQKDIISQCNLMGKSVITATQMLESMITSVTPTRAEAADISNAILDGSDALMLSAETAVSSDPVNVIHVMKKIITKTEVKHCNKVSWGGLAETLQSEPSEAIANGAARIASLIHASCIVCLTSSGSTARRIAKFRPNVPIYVFTNSDHVCRICELFWGCRAFRTYLTEDVQQSIQHVKTQLMQLSLIQPMDKIVFTLGTPMGIAGSTNLIQIVTA